MTANPMDRFCATPQFAFTGMHRHTTGENTGLGIYPINWCLYYQWDTSYYSLTDNWSDIVLTARNTLNSKILPADYRGMAISIPLYYARIGTTLTLPPSGNKSAYIGRDIFRFWFGSKPDYIPIKVKARRSKITWSSATGYQTTYSNTTLVASLFDWSNDFTLNDIVSSPVVDTISLNSYTSYVSWNIPTDDLPLLKYFSLGLSFLEDYENNWEYPSDVLDPEGCTTQISNDINDIYIDVENMWD